LTLGCGISRDFDFVGFRDFGGIGCVVFYVTLVGDQLKLLEGRSG